MVVGLFISSAGASMIWPFLMIFVSEKLNLSLSTVSTLITINALMGLFASFIAGSISDKLGRKLVMVISLAVNSIGYLFMSRAQTYAGFALMMLLMGAVNPLYQVGSDAMLADMIPSERRTNAYAIIRMVNNAGIAPGPVIGGFIASRSYIYAFVAAATGMITYSLLVAFRARETLNKAYLITTKKEAEFLGGYDRVFDECFFQLFVTQISRRFRPLPVAAIGMAIYAFGVGSVALMNNLWGFWISMVLMTFGELTLIPTVSKYIADHAPTNMRGRYMSVYWFAWAIARGAAPRIGGLLNDNIGQRSIWIGGLILGLTSASGLLFLSMQKGTNVPA